MTAQSAGGQGRGLVLGALGGLALLAVAGLAYGLWGRAEHPDPAPVAQTDGEVGQTAHTAQTESGPVGAAPEAVAPQRETPPAFDVVRVAPDGTAVIAGTAAPGSRVTVVLDDAAQETVSVDASGKFAALLNLPEGDGARVLLLESTQDGQKTLSQDQIVLAPTVRAAADTQTAPDRQAAQEPVGQAASAEQPAEPLSDVGDVNAADDRPTPATPEPAQAALQPQPAAPVTVLRAGPQGVELMRPAAPDGPAQPNRVALDAISYSAAGAVQLSGRAKGASTIRVYLDNRALSDLDVSGDGRWSGTLGEVEPGIYTLRLDEIAPDGEVLSRLETPFKREAPEALDATQGSTAQSAPVRAVTVQRGDTLWAISRERYGDGLLYVRVFQANSDAIRNPDLIYPGQIFTIPD